MNIYSNEQPYRLSVVLTIVCLSFLFVTGAFWDWGKKESQASKASKKESTKKQSGQAREPKADAQPAAGSASAPLVHSKPFRPVTTTPSVFPKPVKIAAPPVRPAVQQVQIAQVQTELLKIIEQTRQLEQQARVDRVQVDRILTQARIHEQILKSMQPPGSVQTEDQVNLAKILDQEKLKLIAKQAEQNRQELLELEQKGNQASEPPARSPRKKKS